MSMRMGMRKSETEHRDLKSTSHKNLSIQILTIQGIILGHEESKKDCLNSCRNRSAHPRDGDRTHDLKVNVVRKQNLVPILYNIDGRFTETHLNCSII